MGHVQGHFHSKFSSTQVHVNLIRLYGESLFQDILSCLGLVNSCNLDTLHPGHVIHSSKTHPFTKFYCTSNQICRLIWHPYTVHCTKDPPFRPFHSPVHRSSESRSRVRRRRRRERFGSHLGCFSSVAGRVWRPGGEVGFGRDRCLTGPFLRKCGIGSVGYVVCCFRIGWICC